MKKFTTFFLIIFFSSLQAHAFSVEHDFFVTVGMFDASITKFTYNISPKEYKITSNVSTNGVFDSIYPFQAIYQTSGKIANEQMIVTDYNYESKSRSKTRGKKVFFNKHGEPQYQISSKNGKEKKREFKPSPTPADTFDLQTVLAKLAYQYNELGFCDSKLSVYDGKRRFDVTFKDEGYENLSEHPNSKLLGKAAKCSLRIDKILSEDDDALWEFSVNKPIYFWIVRDTKTNNPLIARIQIKNTPLGELNAYAQNITIKE